MSSHPNLTHHLVGSLNAICGRFYRAGDKIPNPGVLSRPTPRFAQALNVPTAWGRGAQCRVRPEYGELKSPGRFGLQGEMPTSQLADEILVEGEGQVRALFVIAGNPILAWPDQEKTLKAMKSLDLLVCIDPYMRQRPSSLTTCYRQNLRLSGRMSRFYQTLGTRSPIASTAKPSCKRIMT